MNLTVVYQDSVNTMWLAVIISFSFGVVAFAGQMVSDAIKPTHPNDEPNVKYKLLKRGPNRVKPVEEPNL